MACGDGRHAEAFAALGLDVTALDNSMPQLLRAARRNEASKFNFDILHGDMRSLPRDRTYDAVTCLGSSFGYFESDEQNRQCLQDMVEVLKPGGKLALQVFNRDYLMGVLPCRSWWQGRGCLVLDVADMHFATGRVRIHRTVVFEDGRQFEHHISIRAYSAHTLAKMLAPMGTRVIELSGSRDTRGRFYGGASPEIWIFAQRRDDVRSASDRRAEASCPRDNDVRGNDSGVSRVPTLVTPCQADGGRSQALRPRCPGRGRGPYPVWVRSAERAAIASSSLLCAAPCETKRPRCTYICAVLPTQRVMKLPPRTCVGPRSRRRRNGA
ncbi:class I SAM-dependent methyltransferase [Nannocystis pusilla]|uniref:class I SAM-dependent methyltransferase n=1 Tax=Nannocystis pusilla TaxID=889268 RepID=UPI003B816C43